MTHVVVVASFTTLQLFSAYNLGKSTNSHLTILYNILLYHDTKVAIYQYTQIVYCYISNTCIMDFQMSKIFSKVTCSLDGRMPA